MATGRHIGYNRASSEHLSAMTPLGAVRLDEVFEDPPTGKGGEWTQLETCLNQLTSGDSLYLYSMDRLARDLDDLSLKIRLLMEKGVTVIFQKEGLSLCGEGSLELHALLSVLGAVENFDKSRIQARQREGIDLAKKAGVYSGRKSIITAEQAEQIQRLADGGASKTELAKQFGCSRETIYFYLRRR